MDFIDFIDVNGLYALIESIKGLIDSLIHFFSIMFGWLGPGIITTIVVGAAIAIVLRVLGR